MWLGLKYPVVFQQVNYVQASRERTLTNLVLSTHVGSVNRGKICDRTFTKFGILNIQVLQDPQCLPNS